MKAYTYSIRHIPTNRIYYGVRKSSVPDIGIKYFSSSKLIKKMIKSEPISNFEFRIRRRFESYSKALLHESKLLSRVKAVTNSKMLNQAVSSPTPPTKDIESESERRIKISKRMKELWNTDSYRTDHPFINLSKEERKKRGRTGGLKTASKNIIKEKKPKIYSDVVIMKNGIHKTIKRNQVPAYEKYGWTRL